MFMKFLYPYSLSASASIALNLTALTSNPSLYISFPFGTFS